MAHFEKFKFNECRGVINHDLRIGHVPDYVDRSLSHLNYNLADQKSPLDFIQQKIDMSKKSGGRFVAGKTVAMISGVVTLPAGWVGDSRPFFEQVKSNLDSHFGAENVASCVVHLDESTARPHMHYKVVPLLEKQKTYKDGHTKTIQQFDANTILNRSYLQKFHQQLEDELEQYFGHRVGILTGTTTRKQEAVKELEQETKRLKQGRVELVEYASAMEQERNKLRAENEELKKQNKMLRVTIKGLREELERVKSAVVSLQEKLKAAVSMLRSQQERLDYVARESHSIADEVLEL